MTRKLVFGDIHGGFKALVEVFEKAKITTADHLIFLGDYVDGWSQSPEVLDFLIAINQTHNCTFIRGNHDQLFLDYTEGNKENFDLKTWLYHGGEATINAYKFVSKEKISQHVLFLKALKNYYIDAENRLFVHAGFTNLSGVEYEYFPKLFYWERTLWETACALDKSLETSHVYYPKRLTLYKEIYIGHTPVTKIKATIPVQMANVWNVDTGAAFKGFLTVLDVETKVFWQSSSLSTLYPNENGRN